VYSNFVFLITGYNGLFLSAWPTNIPKIANIHKLLNNYPIIVLADSHTNKRQYSATSSLTSCSDVKWRQQWRQM